MKYAFIFLTFFLTTHVCAQEPHTQITNVARKIITNTTGVPLTDAQSRVSPHMEQQIRQIADQLALAHPPPQTTTPNPILSPSLFSKIKNNLFIGLGIFAILILVHFALKKYDQKRTGGPSKSITNITHTMRNAPHLFALILPTHPQAETLARTLIAQHLIARADILPQQNITASTHGVLLIAQTVKGRFKTLQKHLQTQSLTPLPIPILRGHKDHLQWIVNTADGK